MREKWAIRKLEPSGFHLALFDADTEKPAICPCCDKPVQGKFNDIEAVIEYMEHDDVTNEWIRANCDDIVMIIEEEPVKQ